MTNDPPWRGGWQCSTVEGSVRELLDQSAAPVHRVCVFKHPVDRAIVFGSTQPLADADKARASAAGVELERRRSGGGAVLVGPREQVWLDMFVPRQDLLSDHDVARAAMFIGELWCAALRELSSLLTLQVHRGALLSNRWSKKVCFAGLGPGEVLLDDCKLVGVSQRRDRNGAWFFSTAFIDFDSSRHLAPLSFLDYEEERRCGAHLDNFVVSLPFSQSIVEGALCKVIETSSTMHS